ncbi:interleukin-17C-like isoform X1 [Polypterus senegalus]|uniref:interleukin-17C-like isoform X1 n=1 Tax=Polypterus senegalus TaxID=55291 RepID=UPI001964F313|nr:interleukin-17C-like isoform X1 [Polypterus senegalus]
MDGHPRGDVTGKRKQKDSPRILTWQGSQYDGKSKRDTSIQITLILLAETNELTSEEEMSECRNEIPAEMLGKRMKVQKRFMRHIALSDRTCPKWSPSMLASSNIENRSLSPWGYRINRQAGRFPETIMEAHCLCPGCLDLKRQTFTMDYVSVPITRKESVYYIEQCKNGKFRYNQAWIEVAVGCTCAAPRTVSSS